MNHQLPNDELLSAYLDGEATPQERELVDRALERNAPARQLLEELRMASRGCRELPRFTLGANFAQQVLRKAERAILLSDGEPALLSDGKPAATRDDRPPEAPRLAVLSEPTPAAAANRRRPRLAAASGNWLRLAAALLVLAPALTLMILAGRGPESTARTLAEGDHAAKLGDADTRSQPSSATTYDSVLSEEVGQGAFRDESHGGRADRSLRRGAGHQPTDGVAEFDNKRGGEKSPPVKATGGPQASFEALSEAGGMQIKPAEGMFFGGLGGEANEAPGTVVVHVAITDETWRKGPDKLFARHKELKAAELGRRPSPGGPEGDSRPDDKALDLSKLKSKYAADTSRVGVWNVEASQDDLRALLTTLREETQTGNQVLALAVQPPLTDKDMTSWSSFGFVNDFFLRQKQLEDQEHAERNKKASNKSSSGEALKLSRDGEGKDGADKDRADEVRANNEMRQRSERESVSEKKSAAAALDKSQAKKKAEERGESSAESPSRGTKQNDAKSDPGTQRLSETKKASPTPGSTGASENGSSRFAPAKKAVKPSESAKSKQTPAIAGGGGAPAKPEALDGRDLDSNGRLKNQPLPRADYREGGLAGAPRARAVFIFYVPNSPPPAASVRPPAAAKQQ
jgi:hypothetical protein